MAETAGNEFSQRLLSGMAEGSVAKVMPQSDGFGQILIQTQGFGDGAGYLGDFKGMGQPGSVMVSEWGEKDLGFVL
jgi:hypothetical protein